MSNKEPGYVYILINPSFRKDWVKIGKSSHPVDVSRQLNIDPAVYLECEKVTIRTIPVTPKST